MQFCPEKGILLCLLGANGVSRGKIGRGGGQRQKKTGARFGRKSEKIKGVQATS